MSQVIDASGNKAFDLRTELRDHKTGKVVIHQPYRMHVSKEYGTRYERHGVLYHPNGDRVDGKPVSPTRVAPPKLDPDEVKGEQIAPGVYAPITPAAVEPPVAPPVEVSSEKPGDEAKKQEANRGTQASNRSRS